MYVIYYYKYFIYVGTYNQVGSYMNVFEYIIGNILTRNICLTIFWIVFK